MPDMDGLELLRAVREEYPDLPFILYTGKGSEEIAVKYLGDKPRGFTVLTARLKTGRAVAGEFNSPRPSRDGSAGIHTRTPGASVRVGGSTPPDNTGRRKIK